VTRLLPIRISDVIIGIGILLSRANPQHGACSGTRLVRQGAAPNTMVCASAQAPTDRIDADLANERRRAVLRGSRERRTRAAAAWTGIEHARLGAPDRGAQGIVSRQRNGRARQRPVARPAEAGRTVQRRTVRRGRRRAPRLTRRRARAHRRALDGRDDRVPARGRFAEVRPDPHDREQRTGTGAAHAQRIPRVSPAPDHLARLRPEGHGEDAREAPLPEARTGGHAEAVPRTHGGERQARVHRLAGGDHRMERARPDRRHRRADAGRRLRPGLRAGRREGRVGTSHEERAGQGRCRLAPRAADRVAGKAEPSAIGVSGPASRPGGGVAMHLGTIVVHHARYRPDHEGVVFEGQRFTWREFSLRVNRSANALLSLGLRKGDAVALVVPNCLELIELYWAAAKTGIVVVPLSPLLRGSGLFSLLRDAGAAAVVSTAELVPVLEEARAQLPGIPASRWILTAGAEAAKQAGYASYSELTSGAGDDAPTADIDGDDVYNIIYRSGTTGLPKGSVHTHAIRAAYCTTFVAAFRMRPESVVMHAGSLIFNGALVTFFPAFFLGTKYVLMKKFDAAAFIETIRRERVTHVMTVPSQIAAILDEPSCTKEALSSIEMLCSVGAPLHREHKERLRPVARGSLYELYGLTEGFITILDKEDYDRKLDSVGCPTYMNEMRIVGEDGRDLSAGEVGEIVGRGPMLMPGYHARPDLTAQAIVNGWL